MTKIICIIISDININLQYNRAIVLINFFKNKNGIAPIRTACY